MVPNDSIDSRKGKWLEEFRTGFEEKLKKIEKFYKNWKKNRKFLLKKIKIRWRIRKIDARSKNFVHVFLEQLTLLASDS